MWNTRKAVHGDVALHDATAIVEGSSVQDGLQHR